MSLFDYFREECVQVGTSAKTKDDLLHEIAKLAKQSQVLEKLTEEELYKALSEREKLGSTGFADGIAIPHCRLDAVNEFVIGLISVPAGIAFEALDKKPSTLIFFIIAPESDRNNHVRILSGISRAVSMPKVRDELLSKLNATDLREAFLRHVSDTKVAQDIKETKCIFHIAIQDLDKFEPILETLSSLSASISVLESNSASSYLNSLPLFSSFWNDKDKGFHRLITGTINKKLVNELIRNCEMVAGNLDDASDITVTIQDVLYSNGSLE